MYHVILAGGSGSRFWPKSREDSPKQLIKILGDETMIRLTYNRLRKIAACGRARNQDPRWVGSGRGPRSGTQAGLAVRRSVWPQRPGATPGRQVRCSDF